MNHSINIRTDISQLESAVNSLELLFYKLDSDDIDTFSSAFDDLVLARKLSVVEQFDQLKEPGMEILLTFTPSPELNELIASVRNTVQTKELIQHSEKTKFSADQLKSALGVLSSNPETDGDDPLPNGFQASQDRGKGGFIKTRTGFTSKTIKPVDGNVQEKIVAGKAEWSRKLSSQRFTFKFSVFVFNKLRLSFAISYLLTKFGYLLLKLCDLIFKSGVFLIDLGHHFFSVDQLLTKKRG